MQGVTTSIRLNPELRDELDKLSRHLHRGKNWIIIKALEEYFLKYHKDMIAEEARRQSILISKSSNPENDAWEESGDTTGWN